MYVYIYIYIYIYIYTHIDSAREGGFRAAEAGVSRERQKDKRRVLVLVLAK